MTDASLRATKRKVRGKAAIARAFSGRKAFLPFLTCGDPDLETTKAIIRSLVDAGADLIELGIPFSDPTAEGPVIQEASIRALKNKVTTDDVFDMAEQLRNEGVETPFVIMTYANVPFSYGTKRFMKRARQAGIDGLILPDLPYEEREEFLEDSLAYDVPLISLIAPTSKERIARIVKDAQGFLYLVSSLGVTGTRSQFASGLEEMIETIRASSDLPVAIGFGISSPEQAAAMAHIADGAIVGSALVSLCGKYPQTAPEAVGNAARALAEAIHQA